MQTDSLISGLVGVAIGALPTSTLVEHLDQLSARDCELLYQVCVEWLGEPSPLPRILEGERCVMKQHLAEMKGQAQRPDSFAPALVVARILPRDCVEDALRWPPRVLAGAIGMRDTGVRT